MIVSHASGKKLIRNVLSPGRQLTATQLHEMGLVGEVFLSGHLMEEAIPR